MSGTTLTNLIPIWEKLEEHTHMVHIERSYHSVQLISVSIAGCKQPEKSCHNHSRLSRLYQHREYYKTLESFLVIRELIGGGVTLHTTIRTYRYLRTESNRLWKIRSGSQKDGQNAQHWALSTPIRRMLKQPPMSYIVLSAGATSHYCSSTTNLWSSSWNKVQHWRDFTNRDLLCSDIVGDTEGGRHVGREYQYKATEL